MCPSRSDESQADLRLIFQGAWGLRFGAIGSNGFASSLSAQTLPPALIEAPPSHTDPRGQRLNPVVRYPGKPINGRGSRPRHRCIATVAGQRHRATLGEHPSPQVWIAPAAAIGFGDVAAMRGRCSQCRSVTVKMRTLFRYDLSIEAPRVWLDVRRAPVRASHDAAQDDRIATRRASWTMVPEGQQYAGARGAGTAEVADATKFDHLLRPDFAAVKGDCSPGLIISSDRYNRWASYESIRRVM